MYRRKTDEKLLEELLGRGYGVDERKRRREKWLRSVEVRNRIEKRRQRERQPQRTDRRSAPAVLGERASEDGVAAPADPRSRREEDALVRPSPRLRRRIDRYAYRNGYRITGPYERVMSFFTHFLPDIRDGVSWSLVEMLVRGRGYRVDNPAAYCLADNMDALYFSSRLLLGRQGHARPRQGAACASLQARIDGALRRKEPFAHAFLTLFARSDEQLRRSLDVILAMARGGRRVGVGSLVRTVKYVYSLTLLLQDLDPAYMEETYRRIAENGRAYVSTSAARMQIEVALHRLRIAVSNLVEYRHQLFPALLKMLGTFFREERSEDRENWQRIADFVGLADEERRALLGLQSSMKDRIESVGREPASVEHAQDRRGEDSPSSAEGKQAAERTPGFRDTFETLLKTLKRIFPGSGIERLDQWPVLLPYFDLRVFSRNLSFPPQVQHLSRHDPLGQIMILHRIIDNMLSSVKVHLLDDVMRRDGELARRLGAIAKEWERVEAGLFTPYLKELGDYVRMVDPEGRKPFGADPARTAMEESISQLANLAFRHYEVVLVGTKTRLRHAPVRLYGLVEGLYETLAEVRERTGGRAAARKEPEALRLTEEMAERGLVDFEVNAYKPTVGRFAAYMERRFREKISGIGLRAQRAFLETLLDTVDLYFYLICERESFYRAGEGKIHTAGEEEREAWERARQAAADPIRLEETEPDYTTDGATGLCSPEYWRESFPEHFAEMRERGGPLSLILARIDGWQWIDGPAGRALAVGVSTVIDELSRGCGADVAFSYRAAEDRFCLIVPETYEEAYRLAERLRAAHAERRGSSDGPDGTVVGTLSIGVARVEDCSSAAEALERVRAAAALAGADAVAGAEQTAAGAESPAAGD